MADEIQPHEMHCHGDCARQDQEGSPNYVLHGHAL